MSALGERAAKAQDNIADLEAALEKTQRVLQSAEKVDQAAASVSRRGRKLMKLLLVLTVVGVSVLVAKKLLSGSGNPPGNTDPYGSSSTDR